MHRILYIEAIDPIEGDEKLSEELENKYGFQKLEVSPNEELLFRYQSLIGT